MRATGHVSGMYRKTLYLVTLPNDSEVLAETPSSMLKHFLGFLFCEPTEKVFFPKGAIRIRATDHEDNGLISINVIFSELRRTL